MTCRSFLNYSLLFSCLGSTSLFGAGAAALNYTGTTAGLPTQVIASTVGFDVTVDSANSGDWKLAFNSIAFDQAAGVLIPAAYPTRGADHINSASPGRAFIEVPGRYTEAGATPTFANGWLSLTDISGAGTEANYDLGFIYFPHSEGWVAGSISSTGAINAGNLSGVTIIKDTNDPGRWTMSIAGVDARLSGMLFTVGGDNANSGNVVTTEVLADGSGWEISSYDQGGDFLDTDGDLESDGGENGSFHFAYVPYNTQNLIGGRVTDNGSILNGTGGFTASRLSTGTYFLQIADGQGGFLGPSDGLVISNISKAAVKGTAVDPDDNYLETLYNPATLGWEIRSFDLSGGTIQDTEFVFAYTSYEAPLAAVPEPASALFLSLGAGFLLTMRRRQTA